MFHCAFGSHDLPCLFLTVHVLNQQDCSGQRILTQTTKNGFFRWITVTVRHFPRIVSRCIVVVVVGHRSRVVQFGPFRYCFTTQCCWNVPSLFLRLYIEEIIFTRMWIHYFDPTLDRNLFGGMLRGSFSSFHFTCLLGPINCLNQQCCFYFWTAQQFHCDATLWFHVICWFLPAIFLCVVVKIIVGDGSWIVHFDPDRHVVGLLLFFQFGVFFRSLGWCPLTCVGCRIVPVIFTRCFVFYFCPP